LFCLASFSAKQFFPKYLIVVCLKFFVKKKALFARITLIEFLVNGGSYGKGKTKDRFLLGG
jgi:hypothetical protein